MTRSRATHRMGSVGTPPGTPTGFAVVFISSTEIDVGWTPADSSQTGFLLQRAPDVAGSPGAWATIAAAIASNVTTYQNTGLAPSTTYWYKIQAFNGAGSSAFTAGLSATTSAAGSAPGTPTGTTATGVSSTQVNTSWSAGTGGTPTSYTLQRSASGAGVWSTIYTGATASFQDTGLVASTTYDYRVQATNSFGTSANSATFSGATLSSGTLSIPNLLQPLSHISVIMPGLSATPIDQYLDSLVGGTPLAGYTYCVSTAGGSDALIAHVHAINPGVGFSFYTNIGQLIPGGAGAFAVEDWLAYADAHGYNREDAFLHASAAFAFSGAGSSARPVRWFYALFQINAAGSVLNTYTQSSSTTIASTFGAAVDDFLALGNLDRFVQIDATITTPLAGGYTYAIEYPTAVDGSGNPTAWATLTTLTDTTLGLTVTGTITWDVPTAWVPCTLNSTYRCYYFVRIRCTHTGTTPVASKLYSRDYYNGVDTISGTVPAFDSTVDGGSKGYLTAAEYAARGAGKDAHFRYEGRLPATAYGAQRHCSNAASASFVTWACVFYKAQLDAASGCNALFLDNMNLHNKGCNNAPTVEDLTTLSTDWYNCLQAVWAALQAGGTRYLVCHGIFSPTGSEGDPCIRACRTSWDESRIKGRDDWTVFDDTLACYDRLLALSPSVQWLGIDVNSVPLYGTDDVTEPRFYLSGLCAFYNLHSPGRTYISFDNGNFPSSSWQNHYRDVVAFNVGAPAGARSKVLLGNDPAKPAATPAATPSGTGGTIADGTYYYKISYGKTGSGACESLPSTTEGTFTVSGGGTSSVSIASPALDGKTPGWFLYVGSVSGGPYYRQGTDSAIGVAKTLTSLTLSGTQVRTQGQTAYVYQRDFTNPDGLVRVYYRPVSHSIGNAQGTICDSSAITITLPQAMKPVNIDGTKGSAVSSFSLKAWEGAIYVL